MLSSQSYSQERYRVIRDSSDQRVTIIFNPDVIEGFDIYLSLYGLITNDTVKIMPEQDTSTLVFHQNGFFNYENLYFEGVISKNSEKCANHFPYPYTFNYAAADIFEKIRATLQDSLGFSIFKEYKIPNGAYFFETSCTSKKYLVAKSETSYMLARRVSYVVELHEFNGQMNIKIKPSIEYRRKGHDPNDWRLETDDNFYLQAFKVLRNLILN